MQPRSRAEIWKSRAKVCGHLRVLRPCTCSPFANVSLVSPSHRIVGALPFVLVWSTVEKVPCGTHQSFVASLRVSFGGLCGGFRLHLNVSIISILGQGLKQWQISVNLG